MMIWKYSSNGTLNDQFGEDGVVVYNSSSSFWRKHNGNAIVLDNTENIYITGNVANLDDTLMALWKYKSDGTLDTSFAGDGVILSSAGLYSMAGDRWIEGNDIALDGAGNVYVTGHGLNGSFFMDMVTWKYQNDGILDTTFNGNGIVVHNNAAGGDMQDHGNSIVLDSAGNVYVTGDSQNADGNADMVIWKYK